MVFTQNETKFRRVVPLILIPSQLKECVSLNRSVELLGLWGEGTTERLLPFKEKTMLGFALLLFAVAIPQMQALLIEPESVRV